MITKKKDDGNEVPFVHFFKLTFKIKEILLKIAFIEKNKNYLI